MPKYRSTFSDIRIFPTLGLVMKPDDVVELDLSADVAGLELVGDEKAKIKSNPVAPAAANIKEV